METIKCELPVSKVVLHFTSNKLGNIPFAKCLRGPYLDKVEPNSDNLEEKFLSNLDQNWT